MKEIAEKYKRWKERNFDKSVYDFIDHVLTIDEVVKILDFIEKKFDETI